MAKKMLGRKVEPEQEKRKVRWRGSETRRVMMRSGKVGLITIRPSLSLQA